MDSTGDGSEFGNDLQAIIANAEISFLDGVEHATLGDQTPENREMVLLFLSTKYLSSTFQARVEIMYANSRPGAEHQVTAAEFALAIDTLLDSSANLVFTQKVWPYLQLPLSELNDKLHASVALLSAAQREYIDLWKSKAWQDERDCVRAPANNNAQPFLVESKEGSRRGGDGSLLREDLVSPKTAMEYLAIKQRALQTAIKAGKLETTGLGQYKKITSNSLRKYRPPEK